MLSQIFEIDQEGILENNLKIDEADRISVGVIYYEHLIKLYDKKITNSPYNTAVADVRLIEDNELKYFSRTVRQEALNKITNNPLIRKRKE